jgi:stearoyl-CoA desaturase (delta-9 desaturase)
MQGIPSACIPAGLPHEFNDVQRVALDLLQWFDSDRRSRAPFPANREDRIEWARLVPFGLMHVGALCAPLVGWSPVAVLTAIALYALRMFGITAFYHRFLSHRAFTASRPLVFFGSLLATAAAQRGPLWWAAHHRKHHRHSDDPADAHSPKQHGFWWSHVGWFTTRRNFRTDHQQVRDLCRYPELVLLDRFDVLAPFGLAALLYASGELMAVTAPQLSTNGLQMLVIAFCLSTTAVFHATSAVNSLGHVFGSRAYPTRDDSRNSLLLALLTFGEGWHNNHHHCPGSARQGFRWWQVDLTWYLLRLLALAGLVRDLRQLPARVVAAGGRRAV